MIQTEKQTKNSLKYFIYLQVEYKDFPKNNKNEFVSLINCSSQPPLISHGIGKDVESCHDMVSLSKSTKHIFMILSGFSSLGLSYSSVTPTRL